MDTEAISIFQGSDTISTEERTLQHSSHEDVYWDKFKEFYEKKYKEECYKEHLPNYLINLRLAENDKLNVAGALLFGKNTQKLTPEFFITAIWFWGNDITDTDYRSSGNIIGTLDQQYRKGYDFILSKLHKLQSGQSFNSLGIPGRFPRMSSLSFSSMPCSTETILSMIR